MKKFLIFLILLILLIIPQIYAEETKSLIINNETAYGKIIEKEGYSVSRSKIHREILIGEIFVDSILIKNFKNSPLKVNFQLSEKLKEVITLSNNSLNVEPNNESQLYLDLIGIQKGEYSGEITLTGDVNERLDIILDIVNITEKIEFFVKLDSVSKRFNKDGHLSFTITIDKLTREEIKNISLYYYLIRQETKEHNLLGMENIDVAGSTKIRKIFDLPKDLPTGYYTILAQTKHLNQSSESSSTIQLVIPLWKIKLFGIFPIWLIILILSLILLTIFLIIIIRRTIEKRKKYKMQVDLKSLATKNDRAFWLGKIAETNIPAYLDADALTTHGVVAGATGGGKSIAAQVLIEEALIKGISVIVFDPTAQWSGMLRKCDDKKMLSFYANFGMKPQDARFFPGKVKQIQNERQFIDLKKYMAPGQIQIFTMNKLTPAQIDIFVANMIASIFKSDPKEQPVLTTLLVFDEVHRLLPKFGGSGKGFLQIERACREFRKWGFGVMLVSQVLSDFVGEIKANINTEIQMRTRDEADLNRLKTKYGEEFLQSLIKASVGVGMMVNPKYNKGKPFFINFRPILHNTRRLTDQVLEQYNKYTDIIEDLDYQIEQLEAEKVDVFDIKMELKLVKDKLVTGNFTVVDIYLEGIKPRIEKQWQSLGKTPKKIEIQLVETKILESALAKAEESRKDFNTTKEEKKEEKKDEPKEDKDKPKEDKGPAKKE